MVRWGCDDSGDCRMKKWLLMMSAIVSASIVGAQVAVPAAVDDDDEYEEIVIRRKKKPKQTVVIPASPVVAPAAVKPKEPPPPPEPPAAEAAEPRRLVHYFCKVWKDEDWERLWWAMTPKYRKNVSLKKFKTIFTEDAELNGGLKDEKIADVSPDNSGMAVMVELNFKFRNAKPRVVKALVERIVGGQYRVSESAILPVDLSDL